MNHRIVKLEIKYKRKLKISHNILLDTFWINEDVKVKIKKYMKNFKSDYMSDQDVWDPVKAAERGKLIATQSYIEK